jgi:hypothetical protein
MPVVSEKRRKGGEVSTFFADMAPLPPPLVNCQKACKKCDDGRPCQRCIKYGLTETCIDSVRKERKKGVKRGPYKRRNQANSSSASASPTPTPNNIYAQSPATANPGLRQSLPFNYSQFPQYDSFNATSGYPTYGYSNMMPPNYQHNPNMVSYQGLGVMPPQQQQQQQQHHQQHHQQQQQQQHDMSGRPVNHSPQYQQHQQPQAAESKSQPNEAGEDEDGNKLSILSQLCSAVLDNTDAPKQEEGIEDGQAASQPRQQQSQEQAPSRYLPVHSNGTPPPSRGHSRTSSFEQQQQYPSSQFGHDSPHTYVNGQLRANVYGTPNSSPSNSPVNNTYNKSGSQQQPTNASGSWPLPSLQSVVSPAQNNQANWQQGW